MRFNFGVTCTLNGATVVVGRAPYNSTSQTYLTKATLSIVTHANAKFVKIQDSTGTPVVFAQHNDLTAAAGVPSVVTWDFGKTGIPMSLGKGVNAVSEAAGVAGYVYLEGYEVRG